eukprot:GHRR01001953.1.p1 GENE.GHRR01001953.1~~GHRR01001953.1.p1  ORF type:complete len:1439 (+),score=728.57 GHRR01001953.1:990-5306(+)
MCEAPDGLWPAAAKAANGHVVVSLRSVDPQQHMHLHPTLHKQHNSLPGKDSFSGVHGLSQRVEANHCDGKTDNGSDCSMQGDSGSRQPAASSCHPQQQLVSGSYSEYAGRQTGSVLHPQHGRQQEQQQQRQHNQPLSLQQPAPATRHGADSTASCNGWPVQQQMHVKAVGTIQSGKSGSPIRLNGFAKGLGSQQGGRHGRRQQQQTPLPQQVDFQLQPSVLLSEQPLLGIQSGDLPSLVATSADTASDGLSQLERHREKGPQQQHQHQQAVDVVPSMHHCSSIGTCAEHVQQSHHAHQQQRSHSADRKRGAHKGNSPVQLPTLDIASALTAATNALLSSPVAAERAASAAVHQVRKHQAARVVSLQEQADKAGMPSNGKNISRQQIGWNSPMGTPQEQQQRGQQSGFSSAPSTPGHAGMVAGKRLGNWSTPPCSPQLSPLLLKQFGLKMAPVNGCQLPDDQQLRAAVAQAGAGALLVPQAGENEQQQASVSSDADAHGDSGLANTGTAQPSRSGSDAVADGENSASGGDITDPSSPRSIHSSSNSGSNGGMHRQRQQQLKVQVPDAGMDDCSIASSSSMLASSSTSSWWHQQEPAAQMAGNSHQNNSKIIAPRLQQGPQQHQQLHNAAAGSQYSLSFCNTDTLDVMSDPGTVPGGHSAPADNFGPHSSRNKPGRNRFAAQQQHQQQGPYVGNSGTYRPHDGQATLAQQYGSSNNTGSRHRNGSGRDGDGSSSGSGGRGGYRPSRDDSGGASGGASDSNGAAGGSGGSGSYHGSGGGGGSGKRDSTGRRGSKGSLEYMPRSPQLTGHAGPGMLGSSSSRRSFDSRVLTGGNTYGFGYDGGGRGGSRQTPLLSPGGGRGSSNSNYRNHSHHQLRQDRGSGAAASPHMAGSNSSSSLVGHPSPLLLPEPALAAASPGKGSSSSARGSRANSTGIAPMPELPLSAAGGLPPAGAATDLERFLSVVGPTVPVNPAMPLQQVLEGLTLKSVWHLFMEPSLWGTPVATLGGPRGPSTAYYVPYMSAMQLFTTVADGPASPGVSSLAPAAASASGNSSKSNSSTGSPVASSSSISSGGGSISYAAAARGEAQGQGHSSPPSVAAAAAAAAAAAPSLACQPLVVSLAHLLRPPSCPPGSPQEVMSTWASLPLQVELSATCVWPGIDGLLLLLSAVARQPLYCAWAQLLPGGVCGVQAAFVSAPVTHTSDTIAIMLIGQLMPEPATVEAELAAAAAAARQQDLQQQRDVAAAADGAAATTGDASSSGQQQEQKQQQPEPVLRGVVQLVVRASSHEVTLTIQQHAAAWVNDISQGTLNVGMSAGCAPPRPSRGKTLLHPRVARLEQQLAAAAAVMPPPAQVPPLELPSPPSFRRKLRAKEDEEDSDAEDEELPPTAEEEVQQAAALDKHKEACEKAAAAHAAAKRARATAVLRKAALAEWRRAACPTPL